MNKKITIFIFALICFFVDGITLCIFEYPISQLLLALTLYVITFGSRSDALILCCLVGIQDLMLFGHAGIQLLYLVPLSLLSYLGSHILYATHLQLMITACITGFLQLYIVRYYFLGNTHPPSYTAHSLYGILGGVVLISLIIWLGGMLGNRMHRKVV